jgi:type IV pilus assembly protein PilY1
MSDKQKGDFIYQSTFKYSKNTQWQGHLKKHKFDSKTGKLAATEEWDAAEKLNEKSYTSRNLWTTNTGASGLNNFTTSNRGSLKSLLFPNKSATDAETDKLINFIRGIDSYDEDGDSNTTETRHKLADIYHANINIVGPVEGISDPNDGTANYDKKDAYYRARNGYDNFKNGNSCGTSCSSRTEVVLAGANSGIFHAFKAEDGEELWGYIPPNIIGKLSTMVTSKANASNAIYGIDGSATVKDIYFDDTPGDNVDNPRWRTISMSALGAGGHGYFALDITNIDSPKHLFAIENDPFDNVVRIWNSSENKTEFSYTPGIPMNNLYDYQKLGEAWSAPRIIRIKHDGKDKWVAVVGGGFNGAVNPNYGSAVFVIDLETEGTLLQKIDIEDTSASNIVNSVPSDLAVITADGTEKANYNGALVYAADLEGKVTKINLTDKGTMYQSTILFNAQSTNENGRYIFSKPDATIRDSKLWLYFGTGDKQKLQSISSNTQNRLYGIKDKDFPNFQAINPAGTVSQCKTGGNNCPGTADLGWYINLDKSKKVTAEPTIDKEVVYFPVYEPKPASNACDSGDALLYTANGTCGSAIWRKVGKGVLSKVIVQDGNLIMGISGEVDKSLDSQDNLIVINQGKTAATGKITLEGWKENH